MKQAIMDELKSHPPDFGDADSILEMLYGYYNQYNRMDTDAIKAGFEDLYEKMTGIWMTSFMLHVPSAGNMKNPASWRVSKWVSFWQRR